MSFCCNDYLNLTHHIGGNVVPPSRPPHPPAAPPKPAPQPHVTAPRLVCEAAMTTIERDEMDECRAANPEAALAEAISVAIGCHGAEFESAAIVDPTLVHEALSRFAVKAVMGAPAIAPPLPRICRITPAVTKVLPISVPKGIRAIRIDTELLSERTSLGQLDRNEAKITAAKLCIERRRRGRPLGLQPGP